MTQFAACWGILTGSLVIASPVIFFKIKDTTSMEEDLKFSDETMADVAPEGTLEMENKAQPTEGEKQS